MCIITDGVGELVAKAGVVLAVAACILTSVVLTIGQKLRCSGPVLTIAGLIRSHRPLPRWMTPAVLHVDEIDSATLSLLLNRSVLIVGSSCLSDGQLSQTRKLSYIESRRPNGLPMVSPHPIHYLICKSSPTKLGLMLMVNLLGLAETELRALARLESSAATPSLVYGHVHWTGQSLILMEFIAGDQPTIATGVSSVDTIDRLVRCLAKLHSTSIRLSMMVTSSSPFAL